MQNYQLTNWIQNASEARIRKKYYRAKYDKDRHLQKMMIRKKVTHCYTHSRFALTFHGNSPE